MFLHQTLLFLTALSLHAGFGLVLGILILEALKRKASAIWISLAFAFCILIYLPSGAVILRLLELPNGMRGLILVLGLLTVLLPSLPGRLAPKILDLEKLRKYYPAICMLLLAILSLTSLFLNGEMSGVPLALASGAAAAASLQWQVEPG